MKPAFSPDFVGPRIDAIYRFDGLLFKEICYPPDHRLPPHTHPEAHLIFSLQGTIEEVWKTQSFLRKPSTLIFLPADEPHSNYFQEAKTFQIGLEPPWLERLRQFSALPKTPVACENGLSTWLALRLYHEFQHRDNLTPLMLEGLTLELLAVITRCVSNRAESHIPPWLRRVRDFLNARFSESLSLEEIAQAAGVHPAHLARVFRRHYHCTIGDYLRSLRFEHARHLLSRSDISLAEIANLAGYSDQSHFSTAFKRHTGMTPTEFRQIFSGR